MATVSSLGLMVGVTRASTIMTRKKAKACLDGPMVEHIMVSGKMVRWTVREFILPRQEK